MVLLDDLGEVCVHEQLLSFKFAFRIGTIYVDWTLCLQRATTKNIKLEFHDQHKELCKQWKDAKTQEETETKYNVIKVWWVSSGAATSPSVVRALNDWMAFWHFCYRQWGGYMQLVSDPLIQSVCII